MKKENNGWIHVGDQEPQVNSVVLCFDSYDKVIFMGRVKDIVAEQKFKYLVIYDQFDYEYTDVLGTANFWQPLPGQPELD
ncbi:hypothetical protein ACTUM6_03405 [Basfia succiniciproducens]|uniref:hypothetical protein n=1 Tax=Basfia succiniciproducens TaxID=653940 RepID=UPI003FCC4688